MKLNEYPLASPVPTAAPLPRDVDRKLLAARQGIVETCAFAGGIFSIIQLSTPVKLFTDRH